MEAGLRGGGVWRVVGHWMWIIDSLGQSSTVDHLVRQSQPLSSE